jgi:hypothetical protein
MPPAWRLDAQDDCLGARSLGYFGSITKRTMKLPTILLLASAAFFTSTAGAQYATGFESPPFVSGEINGQDSWTTSAATSTARILTASEIASELGNVGLDPSMPVHGGAQALVVSGVGAGNATIRVITGLEAQRNVVLDVWARPLTGGSNGNIFLTMEDSAGDRAAAFRFGTATAFGMTIDYGTPQTGVWQPSSTFWNADTWYRLTMNVDYATKTYDFSVNGVQFNTSPLPFYNANSDFFSQVRMFRGLNQSGMIVDDLVVTIPEPATMACLLLGGALPLTRRRRQAGAWLSDDPDRLAPFSSSMAQAPDR